MRKAFTTILALAVASLAVPAGAQECVPAEQSPEFDTATIPGGSPDGQRYYVDNDVCVPIVEGGCPSIWIYQESNGQDGLQRNDEHAGDQACGNGDTIIL